jgi:hypothetical protein
MEEQIAKLQTKLKLLNFTAKKTDSTIAKADIEVSGRLSLSIKSMIKAVSDVKETIEEQKFKSGATVENVSEWSDETNNILNLQTKRCEK